jgi:hypothetical protein
MDYARTGISWNGWVKTQNICVGHFFLWLFTVLLFAVILAGVPFLAKLHFSSAENVNPNYPGLLATGTATSSSSSSSSAKGGCVQIVADICAEHARLAQGCDKLVSKAQLLLSLNYTFQNLSLDATNSLR